MEVMLSDNHLVVSNEIAHLAVVINFTTDFRLGTGEALRYAALIQNASQLYEVNPLEVVALIAAESSFQAGSINNKSGDYGLGQVNWQYWGKPNELTTQDLLDPAVNILLTSQIYKHYGEDFSRYHRGNGIKSRAYVINVKSILASLQAYSMTLEKQEMVF